MRAKYLVLILMVNPFLLQGQFPPGAGLPGSTALAADSSLFIAWATTGVLDRGFQQISDTTFGKAEAGSIQNAYGTPDFQIVSLGDGGSITLIFDPPIRDGEGFDFAVFENGFQSGELYFLELGFVEVSSDGLEFVRFPAQSLTDTTQGNDPFGLLDPALIDQLAGKYEAGFGTPFDLALLDDREILDKESVTHVRIVDVVGTLDTAFAQRDSKGRRILDPWPTPFPSSGFDLDAVGVIHQGISTTIRQPSGTQVKLYPNPVQSGNLVYLEGCERKFIRVFNATGRVVWAGTYANGLTTLGWGTGLFFIETSPGIHARVFVLP